MQRYSNSLQDKAGNVVAGAMVAVLLPDGSAADIYSDTDGLHPYESNVVYTDDLGEFSFCADDGLYTLTLTKGDVSVTMRDVQVFDGAGLAQQVATVANAITVVGFTANQITGAIQPDGSLVLGTPQSLGTGNDVQFRGGTFTGVLRGKGKTDGSSPTAGEIGEYFNDVVLVANAVALTSGTNADVSVGGVGTGIVLGPGDYDIGGCVVFTGSATTVVYYGGWTGIALASPLGGKRSLAFGRAGSPAFPVDPSMPIPTQKLHVAVGTTQNLHLSVVASFSGGTLSAYGEIWARRAS